MFGTLDFEVYRFWLKISLIGNLSFENGKNKTRVSLLLEIA